jgi:hypothetical protein
VGDDSAVTGEESKSDCRRTADTGRGVTPDYHPAFERRHARHGHVLPEGGDSLKVRTEGCRATATEVAWDSGSEVECITKVPHAVAEGFAYFHIFTLS